MIRSAAILAALIAGGCSQEPKGNSSKTNGANERQAKGAESRARAMNSIEAARAADRAASVRDRADR